MSKKTRVFVTAAILSTGALALMSVSPVQAAPSAGFNSGFYAGLAGGVHSTVNQFQANYSSSLDAFDLLELLPDIHATYSQPFNFTFNSTGFSGGAFIGYNYITDQKYALGLELSGYYNGGTGRATYRAEDAIIQELSGLGVSSVNGITDVTERARLQYNFDLTVNPGVLINPNTLLYTKFGVSYGRLKSEVAGVTQSTDLSGGVLVTGPRQLFSFEQTQGLWGFVMGAGLTHVCDNGVMFGAEYNFYAYGRKNLASQTVLPAASDLFIPVDFTFFDGTYHGGFLDRANKIFNHALRVRLGYQFQS